MPIRAVEGLRVCEAVHTFKEIDVLSCFADNVLAFTIAPPFK
jgi:hypothetical protein